MDIGPKDTLQKEGANYHCMARALLYYSRFWKVFLKNGAFPWELSLGGRQEDTLLSSPNHLKILKNEIDTTSRQFVRIFVAGVFVVIHIRSANLE